MNVVALAKEKMAEREPIACYDDLHQLVVDLLSMINTWSKYVRGSLRDCPDLTMPKEVRLEEAPEADIIFDINVGTCPPPKQLKTVNLDNIDHCEEDSCSEEAPDTDMEEAATSDCSPTKSEQKPMESKGDQYREYMLG